MRFPVLYLFSYSMTMWVRSDMVRFHAVENSGQEKAEGEDGNVSWAAALRSTQVQTNLRYESTVENSTPWRLCRQHVFKHFYGGGLGLQEPIHLCSPVASNVSFPTRQSWLPSWCRRSSLLAPKKAFVANLVRVSRMNLPQSSALKFIVWLRECHVWLRECHYYTVCSKRTKPIKTIYGERERERVPGQKEQASKMPQRWFLATA